MARLEDIIGEASVKAILSDVLAQPGALEEDRRNMTPIQRTPQLATQEVGPDLQSVFAGFPERTLLEAGQIPIAEIAALALREGQCTNPLYRVHRWFARRLGSQFRAILTGLTLEARDADRFWDVCLGDAGRPLGLHA